MAKVSIKVLGSNQTEVVLNDDTVLFFSYNTLVCLWKDGKYYVTSTKYSKTTSKHINAWLGKVEAISVGQKELEAMVK